MPLLYNYKYNLPEDFRLYNIYLLCHVPPPFNARVTSGKVSNLPRLLTLRSRIIFLGVENNPFTNQIKQTAKRKIKTITNIIYNISPSCSCPEVSYSIVISRLKMPSFFTPTCVKSTQWNNADTLIQQVKCIWRV